MQNIHHEVVMKCNKSQYTCKMWNDSFVRTFVCLDLFQSGQLQWIICLQRLNPLVEAAVPVSRGATFLIAWSSSGPALVAISLGISRSMSSVVKCTNASSCIKEIFGIRYSVMLKHIYYINVLEGKPKNRRPAHASARRALLLKKMFFF